MCCTAWRTRTCPSRCATRCSASCWRCLRSPHMATTDASWEGPDPNDELPEGWGLLCAAAIGGAGVPVRGVLGAAGAGGRGAGTAGADEQDVRCKRCRKRVRYHEDERREGALDSNAV